MNLYHHSFHKKQLSTMAILELETDNGTVLGHKNCSNYIEQSVKNLLVTPFQFDQNMQKELLNELDTVFSDEDNEQLLKVPLKEEVHQTILSANKCTADTPI